MRNSAVVLSILWITLAARVVADEPPLRWVRNLDEAKQIAQAEHKDLLINFTGLNWCHYCIQLEAEVFSKPEFAVAAKDFVMVEIDYPGADERLEGDMKEWFPKLRDYYMVAAYPTVIIADSSGLPVAYTGYKDGITPDKFLTELARDRASRQARDEAQAQAARLSGAERAKKLHESLMAINLNLGTMFSRKVDPLLAFYGNVVNEIKSLDTATGETAKYYDKRVADRKEWDEKPGVAIFEELKRFRGADDASAAIAYLDQMLASVKDDEVRWRVELARQSKMELATVRKGLSKEQENLSCEAALANARRLLSIPPKTDEIRENLLAHEALMLGRLGRTDEMVAQFDERIRQAAEGSPERLALLGSKGNALLRLPDMDRALAALHDYLAATDPKSDDWGSATNSITFALQKAERYSESIAFCKRALEIDPDRFPHFWLEIAGDQQRLGLTKEARKSLDEAEVKLQAYFAAPRNQRKKAQQAFFNEVIAKLRTQLGPKD
ncbi:MAG TPA: thioredoxin family protein [Pirellulales bacterium]|nr:thioredoxin family protein [Pirellulales bacterium]